MIYRGGAVHLEIEVLVATISDATRAEVHLEQVEDTYICECDLFTFAFVLNSELFEVRNIEVFKPGLGSRLISAVHDFCDDSGLDVIASNVQDTAIGFWRKMGYEEGQQQQEYFRVI